MKRPACKTGKVRHCSRLASILALKKIRNVGLNSYRCGHCGDWHLGNSNQIWKIQARIDQLLKNEY
jgi:hypothetical protein